MVAVQTAVPAPSHHEPLNRPLEAIGFVRRLEAVIARAIGLRPRDDEQGARHA